ncbi:hypothetical protein TNIN_16461 [Trichonephila inaurata madagascariensis]|uniref:Transposase n=1 Tax=Trichonephila inaurata madagascariensis TaxID=2747483 RepID=A0A8X6XEN7_9ARAC|nr:hypothetical protein TNIN_16461 [Trichonephila inaurata madagascariensis]
MLPVGGDKCLSCKAVYNWVKKFSQGRSKIVDKDRSCCRVLIATKSIRQQEGKLILADRRVPVDSIITAVGYSPSLAYSIIHDRRVPIDSITTAVGYSPS